MMRNGSFSSAGAVEIRCLIVHIRLPPIKLPKPSASAPRACARCQRRHEVLLLQLCRWCSRDHAVNSKLHRLFRLCAHQGVITDSLEVADITRVMIIILLFSLTAGEDSLSAVDDDDVVTAVNVRGKGGLVLAAGRRTAACAATRPSGLPAASITYHLRST